MPTLDIKVVLAMTHTILTVKGSQSTRLPTPKQVDMILARWACRVENAQHPRRAALTTGTRMIVDCYWVLVNKPLFLAPILHFSTRLSPALLQKAMAALPLLDLKPRNKTVCFPSSTREGVLISKNVVFLPHAIEAQVK